MPGALRDALNRDDAITRRERYERLRAALWTERSSFDAHWRELGDFLLPRRTRFWSGDRNRGDRRNQNIIDSTARFAARTLQSGLHAGLTSPARPWFKLTTPDPQLAEQKPVKTWLHQVTQRMQVMFAGSNLYNILPIVYGDMGVFGTAAMGVLEDASDLFRCYSYPLGSYALGLDARGLVSTFVRDYELTVRQVVEQFGVQPGYRDIDWTRFSPRVKDAWVKGDYQQPIELTWIVTPNDERDRGRLEAKYLPFASCHYERGSQERTFLRESGFETFPILAPRWDITGEDTYGTSCPGMDTLGDVKQLQLQHKRKAKAIDKGLDPPLAGVPELRAQKTSLLPGDITYLKNPREGLQPIHQIDVNLQHLVEDIRETQYRIQRGFFEDLFLMIARSENSQPITAREVEERHEEKLLALGPVLERTDDELLDPLIDRAYALMRANGLLPEIPGDLEGVQLKVEYISIMAQAQKLVGVVSQDRFLGSIAPLLEAFPEIRAKVNAFRIVDNYAEMLGVDPATVRSDEEAQQLVAAQAQEQQETADAQKAALMGRAIKDGASAQMGTDSALDRLTQGTVAGRGDWLQ